jgi:hypothetical protein
MSKKIDRATHGPSWAEIILGVFLSTGLGIVIGAVALMLKPVVTAKEPPKEPDAKAVYYIEGGRDTSKAKQAPAKRAAFAQGQSVSVTEDELNALVGAPAAPAPAAKPGETPPPAAPAGALAFGTPNFRIEDGALQIAAPVTVNVAGLGQKLIVQARGGFVKSGDRFVYSPDKLYVGSCPVERLPFLAGYVRGQFLAAQAIPEDLAAAWPKLANVAIEGKTLTLTMP